LDIGRRSLTGNFRENRRQTSRTQVAPMVSAPYNQGYYTFSITPYHAVNSCGNPPVLWTRMPSQHPRKVLHAVAPSKTSSDSIQLIIDKLKPIVPKEVISNIVDQIAKIALGCGERAKAKPMRLVVRGWHVGTMRGGWTW